MLKVDLQCMRNSRYAMSLGFLALYEKEVGASEPKEDFDDRNALYSMLDHGVSQCFELR